MAVREDAVHYAVREYLKSRGWLLLAGEYPNGTDDELRPLNIVDPELARDRSPDHRRHSKNKLVLDLVAVNGLHMLLIEMKSGYDERDVQKLTEILGDRRTDFLAALEAFLDRGHLEYADISSDVQFIPALAFSEGTTFEAMDGWAYFLVDHDLNVRSIGCP